jgi:hypothetical protein
MCLGAIQQMSPNRIAKIGKGHLLLSIHFFSEFVVSRHKAHYYQLLSTYTCINQMYTKIDPCIDFIVFLVNGLFKSTPICVVFYLFFYYSCIYTPHQVGACSVNQCMSITFMPLAMTYISRCLYLSIKYIVNQSGCSWLSSVFKFLMITNVDILSASERIGLTREIKMVCNKT